MDELNNFKDDLIALLEKHKATICCNVDGDTHGLLYDMSVYMRIDDKWVESKLCDGSEVSANDVK